MSHGFVTTRVELPGECSESEGHCAHTMTTVTFDREPIGDIECCFCGTYWKLPSDPRGHAEPDRDLVCSHCLLVIDGQPVTMYVSSDPPPRPDPDALPPGRQDYHTACWKRIQQRRATRQATREVEVGS